MTRVLLTAAATLVLTAGASAQTSYVQGMFVGTPQGPVELIAYAEQANEMLRLPRGSSLEDVPTVASVQGVLCSLPGWRPVAVWMATEAIFSDRNAERRELRFTDRAFNVYTTELRVADLEDPGRIDSLTKQVTGNTVKPAYVFIGMINGELGRHYMVRLRSDR